MDGLELLKHDHDKVKGLLEKIESTEESNVAERRALFDSIGKEMKVHEKIEEEIFYPALKQHAEAKEVVLEGYEEHHVVDRLLEEMAQVPVDDERWGAKAIVMKENVEHHIEEEEGEMFEKARSIFGESDLQELGRQMEERKRQLSG